VRVRLRIEAAGEKVPTPEDRYKALAILLIKTVDRIFGMHRTRIR